MDPIASALLAAHDSAASGNIDFALLRKAMDVQEQQGARVVEMLEQAAEVSRQSGRLDLYA